mmetsp:Transcript_55002/g.131454  ORF Transcript_55002/g.131454 Transcript_55002/m.131454 type:complete len:231 (+) Transcript_55002:2792-3484(+)
MVMTVARIPGVTRSDSSAPMKEAKATSTVTQNHSKELKTPPNTCFIKSQRAPGLTGGVILFKPNLASLALCASLERPIWALSRVFKLMPCRTDPNSSSRALASMVCAHRPAWDRRGDCPSSTGFLGVSGASFAQRSTMKTKTTQATMKKQTAAPDSLPKSLVGPSLACSSLSSTSSTTSSFVWLISFVRSGTGRSSSCLSGSSVIKRATLKPSLRAFRREARAEDEASPP